MLSQCLTDRGTDVLFNAAAEHHCGEWKCTVEDDLCFLYRKNSLGFEPFGSEGKMECRTIPGFFEIFDMVSIEMFFPLKKNAAIFL